MTENLNHVDGRRARRSRYRRVDARLRAGFRIHGRMSDESAAYVTRNGVVYRDDVLTMQDGHRAVYADRCRVARARHDARVAEAKAVHADAVAQQALGKATANDVELAANMLKRVEAEGEDLRPVPSPRVAPVSWSAPVVHVMPSHFPVNPAHQVKGRRGADGKVSPRQPAPFNPKSAADRGVLAAEARSAARAAAMDAAAKGWDDAAMQGATPLEDPPLG